MNFGYFKDNIGSKGNAYQVFSPSPPSLFSQDLQSYLKHEKEMKDNNNNNN